MELANKRILVVGLGKSGVAAARLLRARGARVIANDLRDRAALGSAADELEALGIELALGGHDAAPFGNVDGVVVSPGVPPLPELDQAEAAGAWVIGEIELASWFVAAPIVGITGTNGKSTVTSLVGEMLERAGFATFVGGNLGTPLVDVAGMPAAAPTGRLVVELSSYQLERVSQLHVHVAALLNVTEDHLDRYPSFEAYQDAKARIFERQTSADYAVVPEGDALCARLAARGAAQLLTFGGARGAVRVEAGVLLDPSSGLRVPVTELRLRGAHNLENACAAALLARLSGAGPEPIAAVLRSFAGLPHRMVLVRELDGVRWFDDSKGTNVGAVATALDGFKAGPGKVVLLAGGKHKGGDYGPLAERLAACGRGVVLIGEAAPLIAEALRGASYPVRHAATLVAAVDEARSLAQPGDTVLLSPACSSFDMFKSYADRGEQFSRAVRALPGGA
jgi:UDP-N-acetylmuramoylalanine--D-glutamate ligase